MMASGKKKQIPRYEDFARDHNPGGVSQDKFRARGRILLLAKG
jgi:hypothetical protein